MTVNAWGEPVAEVDDDPWFVPEQDRLDRDDMMAPDANALEGGDDLPDWYTRRGRHQNIE